MREEFIDAKHAIVGEHDMVDHEYVEGNQHAPTADDAANESVNADESVNAVNDATAVNGDATATVNADGSF